LTFFTSSLWTALATLFRALAGIVVNKIVAVSFGPSGLATFGHFQNLITIITSLPADGVGKPLLRLQAQKDQAYDVKADYANSVFKISFAILISIFFLALLFPYATNRFTHDINLMKWWFVMLLFMLGFVVNYHFINAILSQKKLKLRVFPFTLCRYSSQFNCF